LIERTPTIVAVKPFQLLYSKENTMPIVLRRLQAITNAPTDYDYRWMYTLVDNIAVDEKGNACRLVENEDQWHFDQQILRYHSGLHLAITEQHHLADAIQHGFITLADDPVVFHRLKVDLEEAFDWGRERREALIKCLSNWRNAPTVNYTTGSRTDYYFLCRGDTAAEEVRSQLANFGLKLDCWGPSLT